MAKWKELLKSRKFFSGCAAVALAAVIGGTCILTSSTDVPELPVYEDPIQEVSIEEEETPLAAAPKVTTKTASKTSKKTVKLAKASTKTYYKNLPTTKKTATKTAKSSTSTANITVTTQTTVQTAVRENYVKNVKYKAVTTVVKTTVKTTTTTVPKTTATTAASTVSAKPYNLQIKQIAPKANARVLTAYQNLGFKVTVNGSVSYSGKYDTKTRTITLRKADDTIYHELGHFVAFMAGNADKTSAFTTAYSKEKSKYTGVNKAYVTQNSSEYFAESFKDFTLNPSALKKARPLTYAQIQKAVNTITTARINQYAKVYKSVWK